MPLSLQTGSYREMDVNKEDGPSVDHLIAFLQPAQARHPPVGCGAVQVYDHVVLRHHQLQRADHIAEDKHALKKTVSTWPF